MCRFSNYCTRCIPWMYIDLRTIIISPVLIKNKFMNMASGDNGGGDKGGKKTGVKD